jgi:hypothetical protein
MSRRFEECAKFAMIRELGIKISLAVVCPTCGAASGERWELNFGQPRNEPHRDRCEIAKDAPKENERVLDLGTDLFRPVLWHRPVPQFGEAV